MDIKEIIDSLGLDLTNPETRRGAIEAIKAILDSRAPSDNMSSGSTSASSSEEVEIDPDLIQPSIKHQSSADDFDDIEIEDEENLLDQVKHNESEDDFDSNSSGNDQDSLSTQDNNSKNSDSEAEPDLTDNSNTTDSMSSTEKDPASASETPTDENDEKDDFEETELSDASDSSVDELDDSENFEDSEETKEFDNEETNNKEENDLEIGTPDNNDSDNESSEENENSEEETFDEDDLLDDALKSTYEDETIKSKQNARKIKRERTLQAAKAALAAAKTKKSPASLIRELEKSIEALETLTEAVTKSLSEISDEEFNLIVNRVFDAIEALGDSGLTFTTDKERELQAKEIKADLSNTNTQQELSAEDIAQIRAETQTIQARAKEADKYRAKARSSFKGFQDFLNSLYRAIALQVHIEEVRDDSWAAINRRHSGSGVLQPGKRINELPNKKIPVIDFYFDCSGSWTDRDLAVGRKAVSQLIEMEEAGQIKINIFYFSNNVYNDATSARAEGGTAAWNEIVKNVISTQATNVIIMTDSDMENWWEGEKALNYTVPGYVWYLWRNGENAPRLPRDLKGRGGTQQFSFSTADA